MDTVEAADYFDLAFPSDPRVAPDGESVAFVRTVPSDDETTESTVYLASTGGGDPRRFTVAEGRDSEPRFSPSGDRLAFVSTRGGDDDRAQLWVVPTDGGEARQVTDVVGGVSGVAWGPAGERIAFLQEASAEDRESGRDLAVPEGFEPEDPDPRVIDRTVYRAAQRYFDGTRSHVYVVALGGDAPGDDDEVRRVTDGDVDFRSPSWGGGDTLYYAEEVGADPDDSIEYALVAHDLASDEADRLHRTTASMPVVAATADGRVAHTSQEPDRASLRPTELHVFDRESGEVADATAALDRSLGYDVDPQWGPDGEFLYVTAADAGSVPVWRVPWAGGDPERVVADGHVSAVDVGSDLVAFARSEWDHPGDVFVATKGGGETNRLTRLNSDYLDGRAVARPEELRVETGGDVAPTTADGEAAADGTELQGWVLTPPSFGDLNDGDEQLPLVVEVHGGPHAMWSTAGTMWHEFQTLAARGYAVFWSNPRGSTGYGEAFAAAIADDWGATTAADVLAGVDNVTDRPGVDADQVFLTGGSFGGFMAAWLVGTTDRFEAAVSQRGVYDLVGFYGSTDAAYKLVEGDFGATPWDDHGGLWEKSPVAYCDRVTTPTLVLHSDEDYRTPADTAELFHRGLRKHGVDTRLVRYPREGHELSRSGEPGHVVDRLERIARWFDGYSEYHDAARALDRPTDAGLTAGADEGDGDSRSDDKDGEGGESDDGE